MFKIQKPLPFVELKTKPEITGMPNLSEDIQQSLALITAFDGVQRHLLRCNEIGVLVVSSPRTNQAFSKTATGAAEDYIPPAQGCSECLIRADSSNSGNIHVQLDIPAVAPDAWPLDANETIKIHPINLAKVNILFDALGDIVHIFPSR